LRGDQISDNFPAHILPVAKNQPLKLIFKSPSFYHQIMRNRTFAHPGRARIAKKLRVRFPAGPYRKLL